MKERRQMGRVKQTLLCLAVTLIVGLLYFYFELPAINLHSPDFYTFIFILCAVYCVAAVFTARIGMDAEERQPFQFTGFREFFAMMKRHCMIPFFLCLALIVLYLGGSLFSSVLLRAGSYTKLLTVENGDFTTDVEEISFDQIPMLDKDSASKLGDRKLGELSDMVSQFEVSDQYNQINYNGHPVRVTMLEYGDLIKWFTNRNEGIPAYLVIDMVTQNVDVVRLPADGGIKYSNSEHFGRYLMRHLRFNYPTFMFDTPKFEINDDGQPYWICPKLEKTIGLFGGTDINGAVLVNAVTGESQYYEEVPNWVDRLYSAELIMQQYDYHGQYQSGFINSIFGQKGVTVTTSGYNYIAMNDDVYVYTGVTSVGGDQSNVGFILTNQRTKETKYYPCAGATEYSAMSSAEGVVQHLSYKATFPLLLNIHAEPTYFIALKDNAGLVKMYAMVNVQQYQIVATGSSVSECSANYSKLLTQNNIVGEGEALPSNEITGRISDIRSVVAEGNTVFYIQLENSDLYYAVSASASEIAVILNVGDRITIHYTPDESEILTATSIER
ncbi:MAG: CvpA family protein [Oscillospiraceae bacterium]|nr:CvpA family protein [Oscillospiraceae bacterium]